MFSINRISGALRWLPAVRNSPTFPDSPGCRSSQRFRKRRHQLSVRRKRYGRGQRNVLLSALSQPSAGPRPFRFQHTGRICFLYLAGFEDALHRRHVSVPEIGGVSDFGSEQHADSRGVFLLHALRLVTFVAVLFRRTAIFEYSATAATTLAASGPCRTSVDSSGGRQPELARAIDQRCSELLAHHFRRRWVDRSG